MSWMTTPTKLEYVLNMPWRCWLILFKSVTYFIQSSCPLENHSTMLLNYFYQFLPILPFSTFMARRGICIIGVWYGTCFGPYCGGYSIEIQESCGDQNLKHFWSTITFPLYHLILTCVRLSYLLLSIFLVFFHSISILLFPFRASSCYFSKQFDLLNSR